jgi:putative two-component system response regulator
MHHALISAGYEVLLADHADEALGLVRRHRLAGLLLEIDLAGLRTEELLSRVLREEPELAVVVATTTNDGERAAQCLQLGAMDFLVKPVENLRLTKAIERALRERDARIGRARAQQLLRDEVTRLSLDLRRERAASEQLSVGTLESLVYMMEVRDRHLPGHSLRVAQVAASIAAELGRTDDEIEAVRIAGRLHDVGMICVGEGILSKPGPLSETEFARMKEHVIIGSEILAPMPNLRAVGSFVRSHHEHWDGSGYPDGLVGDCIPWGARLIAAAEVFDALTTSRPYRREQPLEEAIERIREMKGTVLDPQVVDALAATVDRRRALSFIDGREPALAPPVASALMAG